MSRRIFPGILTALAALMFVPLIANAQRRPTSQPAMNPSLPTLWLIGDSTVKNGQDTGSLGQWGWGHPIASFFDTKRINVQNRALGGTSSRSFINLGLWDRILPQIKPGDFLIMQFGTNDGGALDDSARARGTLHGNGEETKQINNPLMGGKAEVVHTYGWYLRKYVSDAKAKGAVECVICSLVPRNSWANGKVDATTQYPTWAGEAAKTSGADFVDLHAIIARHYEALGQEKVTADIFPPNGEHTHTNWAGAVLNAQCVIEGLKSLDHCELVKYLVPNPATMPAP
jgi:rhamnogalacturonan acetylesterase